MFPNSGEATMTVHLEDAIAYIVYWIREKERGSFEIQGSVYGYDVYIPLVIDSYLQSIGLTDRASQWHKQKTELSSTFFDAAWELCRRGIIRPGVRIYRAQATDEGSAGSGFSVTPFGHKWIEEAEDEDIFIPTEPERFGTLLQPFKNRFGEGYHLRAQEAIRCYGAHAYYACCAMCGAAAESILLALATVKMGDQEEVTRVYLSKNGRSRIENKIVGQAQEYIKRSFGALMELLKYWRDIAAHGTTSEITDIEAFTSLSILLRISQFVDDNWDRLAN
jgi:hypothetical protein